MSNLRFVLAAAALFAFAFAGISFGMPWASKGFPTFVARSGTPSADARPPRFDGSSKPIERHNSPEAEIPRGDNDAGRNRMRLTAIQTANAYAQSPCDQATKAAFVVAASTYLRASTGSNPQGPFSTPMDGRVRDAIAAAFDAGGLSGEELPTGLWTAPVAKSRSPAACASSAGLHRQ